MDIHRCRFVPYPPAAINALAFSHPSSSNRGSPAPHDLRLALGRANGDIEIWNPSQGLWYCEATLAGGRGRSIEGLAWTQDPEDEDGEGRHVPGKLRLFSIGYSTYVTEWDLGRGIPARHSGGNYGEVWCLAAQPQGTDSVGKVSASNTVQEQSRLSQDIAVGCADGAVVLLSTADEDLRFKRVLSRPSAKRARVLSITFQNEVTIVAGCANGTIQVLDARTGTILRNISLGAGPQGGSREILVWALKCLPDGHIVSGDSTGELRIWDGKSHSLVQRLQGHRADILDVGVSADGETIISGGIDRRSTIYKKTKPHLCGYGEARWAAVAHQRMHLHDVKAMATFESKDLSVVVSGGLDTSPIIVPLRQFGRENYRTLSSLPQEPRLRSAPARRLVMSWWNQEVWIWRMKISSGASDYVHDGILNGTGSGRQMVARIVLKDPENIASACMSWDGRCVAIATVANVKLFSLERRPGEERLQVRKVELPSRLSTQGGRIVEFSPDGRWLLSVTPDNVLLVARILLNLGQPKTLPQSIKLKQLSRRKDAGTDGSSKDGLGRYSQRINRVTFSSDSRILVASDLSGTLFSWVLEGYEDLDHESSEPTNSQLAESDAESDSDRDDSEGEEDSHDASRQGKHAVVVYGQHWTQNPSASLLPKLSSATLILSFRPATSIKQSFNHAEYHPHPTRHNPHPHSHDLPSGEDRLLVVTSEHQLLEFEVRKGQMTRWSRQTSTCPLPREFAVLRDRAMGCLWDVTNDQARVWIYGSGWLCMFDLSDSSAIHDTASPPQDDKNVQSSRKRKRWETVHEAKSHTSGAGSRIPGRNLSSRVSGSKHGRHRPGDDSDADVEEAHSDSLLAKLRHGELVPQDVDMDLRQKSSQINGVPDVPEDQNKDSTRFWCTLKYRPILGLVSIGGREAGEGEEEEGLAAGALEVVLVERPMWDVDLPPRFFGDQEWSK
ncbi:MAG: U3 small nucleolar RNA-associated protein [Caeruleum heppii]|nr:MAG: U3 small nucleolar RNA-associated protein [Caeruleum heppii]